MSKLSARPILRAEREKYRRQMDQLHYLGAVTSQFTSALSYVIEDGKGEWVAQLDWGYAAMIPAASVRGTEAIYAMLLLGRLFMPHKRSKVSLQLQTWLSP